MAARASPGALDPPGNQPALINQTSAQCPDPAFQAKATECAFGRASGSQQAGKTSRA